MGQRLNPYMEICATALIPFALQICMQSASDLLSEQLITQSITGTTFQSHSLSRGEFKRSASSENKSKFGDSVVRIFFLIKAVRIKKKGKCYEWDIKNLKKKTQKNKQLCIWNKNKPQNPVVEYHSRDSWCGRATDPAKAQIWTGGESRWCRYGQ